MTIFTLAAHHCPRPAKSGPLLIFRGRPSVVSQQRRTYNAVRLWRLLLVGLCFCPALWKHGKCEEPEVTFADGREAADKVKWPRVSHYCWVKNANLQRLAQSIVPPVSEALVWKVVTSRTVALLQPPDANGVRRGGEFALYEMRSGEACRREAIDRHLIAVAASGMLTFYVVPIKYADGAVSTCHTKGIKDMRVLYLFFNNIGVRLHFNCGKAGDPDPEVLLASIDAAFRPKKLDTPPEPGSQVRSIPLALKSDKPLVTEMVYKLETADIGREEVWFYCPGGVFEETKDGMVVKFLDEGVVELSCVTYDAAGKRSGVGRLLVSVMKAPAKPGP